MLRLKTVQWYKGFCLSEEFGFTDSLVVLTGRNGVGKTRFFESIKGLHTEVGFDGKILGAADIVLVKQPELIGDIKEGGAPSDIESNLTNAIGWFFKDKSLFAEPFNKDDHQRNNAWITRYSAEQLHAVFAYISDKANKSVRELSADDIRLYFVDPISLFGGFSIANISNVYIKKRWHNQYCMWRKTVLGHNIDYVPLEKFEAVFGKEPWVLFNEVLGEVFDGKFLITVPEGDLEEEYKAEFKHSSSEEILLTEELSSGEKTLLWLTVMLFNVQYRESPQMSCPKLLLLDEPDAFLHPKMVLKLYKILEIFAKNFDTVVMLITHSPTTVALSPYDPYVVSDTKLTRINKDEAISELLDGVTQIALNPENQREVFVESQSDANVYRLVFDRVRSNFKNIDPKISLSFLPSGPKMPPQLLRDKLGQHFKGLSVDDVESFILSVNGVGSCSQVVGMVDSLMAKGNRTVKGVIDWDLRNNPRPGVVVMGHNYAYTLENVMLNPVFVIYELHQLKPDKYTIEAFCGKDVAVQEWLKDELLLQNSIDKFVCFVLGEESARDEVLRYISGMVLKTDKRYMRFNGHDLKLAVLRKYPELNCHNQKEGDFLQEMARVMVINLGWSFVPECFESTFVQLQK